VISGQQPRQILAENGDQKYLSHKVDEFFFHGKIPKRSENEILTNE
jgi:hypothetical protein